MLHFFITALYYVCHNVSQLLLTLKQPFGTECMYLGITIAWYENTLKKSYFGTFVKDKTVETCTTNTGEFFLPCIQRK